MSDLRVHLQRWVLDVSQRIVSFILSSKEIPLLGNSVVYDGVANLPPIDFGFVASKRACSDMYFMFNFGQLLWVCVGQSPPRILAGMHTFPDPKAQLYLFRAGFLATGDLFHWELTDCFVWKGRNICHNCVMKRRALCSKFVAGWTGEARLSSQPLLSGRVLAAEVASSSALTFYRVLNGSVWNEQFISHWDWVPPNGAELVLRILAVRDFPSGRPVGQKFLQKYFHGPSGVFQGLVGIEALTAESRGDYFLVVDFLEMGKLHHFCLARVFWPLQTLPTSTHVVVRLGSLKWEVVREVQQVTISDHPSMVVKSILSVLAPHEIVVTRSSIE